MMTIKKYPGYFVKIKMDFDEELNGLSVYQYVFHTQEAHLTKKYNSWNFTTIRLWDSYEYGWWYNPATTELFKTEVWKVG